MRGKSAIMDQVQVPFVSDTSAVHLAGALQWLLGMQPVAYEEEKWTLEEVIKHITDTAGNAVALVMHDADHQDGALRCGPLVSQAIVTCALLGRDYCFLVPMTLEQRLSVDENKEVTVLLSDGTSITQPKPIITSDLRMVPLMLSMRAKKCGEVVP